MLEVQCLYTHTLFFFEGKKNYSKGLMLLIHHAALFQTTATTLKLAPMLLSASKLEVLIAKI